MAQGAKWRYYFQVLKNEVRRKTENRLVWLRRAVVVGLISGLLLSLELWVSARAYPLTPLWEPVLPIPYPMDYLLLGLFVALLAGIGIVRARSTVGRFALLAAIIFAVFFVLQDESRLQPWFYQYSFMIAAFCLYGWGRIGAEGALNACRLIVAAIYFWSGLQKANVSFIERGYPLLIEPLTSRLPDGILLHVEPVLLWSAYAVPVLETAIGLGLLTHRFRKAAVIGALFMHVFILLCLGPWGRDYNSVVWPWNAAMVAFVFILFWRSPDNPSPLTVLKPGRNFALDSVFRAAVLVLFGFMPFLNFFGLWDSYLSSSLYSENTKEGYVLAPKGSSWEKGWEKTRIVSLSLKEMNVPAYPEEGVYENVFARRWCEEGGSPEPLLLVIGRPGIFSGERSGNAYDCDDVRQDREEDRSPDWGACYGVNAICTLYLSVTPAEDATKVPSATNVTATFSEKMDKDTLDTSTFTLVNTETGSAVEAAVSYNEATRTVILDPFPSNPTARLERRTTYTARISGARDEAGNTLADKVWSFKTGGN